MAQLAVRLPRPPLLHVAACVCVRLPGWRVSGGAPWRRSGGASRAELASGTQGSTGHSGYYYYYYYHYYYYHYYYYYYYYYHPWGT